MQKRLLIQFVGVLLSAAVATTAAWVAWQGLRANNICRARAAVKSIEAALAALAHAGPVVGSLSLPVRSVAAEATLAPLEADRLLEQLARMYRLDSPKTCEGTGPRLDPWGNRFVLYWVSRAGRETSQLHAGSSGPDGIWGTADDILAAHGTDEG